MERRLAAQSHRRLAATRIVLPEGTAPSGSRGEILAAALQLFAERGYGGTSVRDIAAVVGLNPATMYAHYPSKEHVLAEIVRIGHEEHHSRLRAAVLGSGGDAAAQLAALVRAHVSMHADYSMLAVVANAELHSLTPAFATPGLSVRQQSQQLMLDVIQRGIDAGAFDVDDAWLAMTAIGGMGLRVAHWYTPEFGKTPAQLGEVYAKYALRLLGAALVKPRAKRRRGR